MKRRTFLLGGTCLLLAPALAESTSARFQYCLLQVGDQWQERRRAIVRLSFEITKRCNIPIESQGREATLKQVAQVNSPFFIVSGAGSFKPPSINEGRLMRLVLDAGGMLLFDDNSDKGDDRFYLSAIDFMARVYPGQSKPVVLPQDHAIYQSYYLLKQARGRRDKSEFLEGWVHGHRTHVVFSHNDLLGAIEADAQGNWKNNMELGGGFRRELCFRLAINLTYYSLTLNYKKDRAFPPIIERRRRL